jgi:hypothetical protein
LQPSIFQPKHGCSLCTEKALKSLI